MSYIYFLAPKTENNESVLNDALSAFPEIEADKRYKYVYKKHLSDIVDAAGKIVQPFLSEQYIYLKAKAGMIDDDMMSRVTDAHVYNRSNQPFNEFWI